MSICSISSLISIPDNCLFASVYDYEICELNKQKYTIFKIQVKFADQSWSVDRRYNEFDRLLSDIKRIEPDIKLKFPGKRLLGDNFSKDFIKKRMKGLDQFMRGAIEFRSVLKCPTLWDFLEINESNIQSSDRQKTLMTKQSYKKHPNKDDSPDDQSVESNESNDINLGNTHNPAAKASDFEFLSVIGKGSFGKVYMAKHKFEDKIYAIKVLKKEAIIRRNEVKHIMAERNVLIRNVKHPFLVCLHYSFQSNDKLYFVLDYVNGGELFYHLLRKRLFPEPRVKFYAAEMAHAIGYMHSKDIIYRDLKPENILIDSTGHIRLTDFGLCKEGIQAYTTTSTFCGTPEYLAPEILLKKPYTRAVDWWCLGSVIYEMLFGLPPFYSKDTNQMYSNILYQGLRMNHNVQVTQHAKNLIVELLQKEQYKRLGASELDFIEIRDHSFFSEISWSDLLEKKIPVPWLPDLDSETDLKHIDPEFTQEEVSASVGTSLATNGLYSNAQNMPFAGFTYISESNFDKKY